jgi:DNA-binding FrmR family transcriptional regulator
MSITKTSLASLEKRIHNVQGQLDGIIKMLKGKKNCLEVLNQFKAASAGLNKATSIFLQEQLMDCLLVENLSPKKRAEIEQITLNLIKS